MHESNNLIPVKHRRNIQRISKSIDLSLIDQQFQDRFSKFNIKIAKKIYPQ